MRRPHLLASDDGFSLTELLIAIVVIGILLMLAIPRFLSVTTQATMTEAKTMLRTLHTYQQAYAYAFDRYGATLEACRVTHWDRDAALGVGSVLVLLRGSYVA